MASRHTKDLPASVKRWLQGIFNTSLDPRDKIRFQLSIWDSRADRRASSFKPSKKTASPNRKSKKLSGFCQINKKDHPARPGGL
ncbi:MAG TPA: hypothetical protein VJC05_01300 [Candidatus Andersenbacteria bacterium]|nr:hypothetical protein [Candidatus Andersenbacteria bacterium]